MKRNEDYYQLALITETTVAPKSPVEAERRHVQLKSELNALLKPFGSRVTDVGIEGRAVFLLMASPSSKSYTEFLEEIKTKAEEMLGIKVLEHRTASEGAFSSLYRELTQQGIISFGA